MDKTAQQKMRSFSKTKLDGFIGILAKRSQKLKETLSRTVGAVRSTIGSKTEIMRDKGSLLEVVFTETQSENPVLKAHVGVQDEKSDQKLTKASDKDGITRIPLMPGEYKMQWICRHGFTNTGRQETITIGDGKTVCIKWQFINRSTTASKPQDEKDKPVKKAKPKIRPRSKKETTPDTKKRLKKQARKTSTGRYGSHKAYGSLEGEEKVIRRIKQLRRKDNNGKRLGPYHIARILNDEGWPTRKATQWHGSQVNAILKRLKR